MKKKFYDLEAWFTFAAGAPLAGVVAAPLAAPRAGAENDQSYTN